jgi:hypothetical protein
MHYKITVSNDSLKNYPRLALTIVLNVLGVRGGIARMLCNKYSKLQGKKSFK